MKRLRRKMKVTVVKVQTNVRYLRRKRRKVKKHRNVIHTLRKKLAETIIKGIINMLVNL